MKIANAQAYAFPGTYTFGDWIGGGTYGKVFKAEVNPGRIPVAVKFLRGRHGRETALEEAMALERAQGCRQVLPLRDAWYNHEAKKTALVFPLMSGDLEGLLRGTDGLAPAVGRKIMGQVLTGVAHIHSRGMIHADIKPGNILVQPEAGPGSEYTVMVSDLGMVMEALRHADGRTYLRT